MGGTTIKLGVFASGKLVAASEIPADPQSGLICAFERMMVVWRQLNRQTGRRPGAATAIAIAIPAIVDHRTGQIYATYRKKFGDANSPAVKRWCVRNLPAPAFWCNDARAALVGEIAWGAARGAKNVCMMTLGTGIGTAVSLDGKLVTGAHGMAGNLGGHCTIDVNGELCPCGNIGCAETLASSAALARVAGRGRRHPKSILFSETTIGYEAVFQAASCDDALAGRVIESALRTWAVTAVNLVHLFDPEILVIGGAISRQSAKIIPVIRKQIKDHSWARWPVSVRRAQLGNTAGLIGAATLAIHSRNRRIR